MPLCRRLSARRQCAWVLLQFYFPFCGETVLTSVLEPAWLLGLLATLC